MTIELGIRAIREAELSYRACAGALELVHFERCRTIGDVNVACLRAALEDQSALRAVIAHVFPDITDSEYSGLPVKSVLAALQQIVVYSFTTLAGTNAESEAAQTNTPPGEVLFELVDVICLRYHISPFDVYDRPFAVVLEWARRMHTAAQGERRRPGARRLPNGKVRVSCPVTG